MKKRFQTFENYSKKNSRVKIDINENETYKDNLSNFILDYCGELGGGMPSEYFTDKELSIIESDYKKIYDTHSKLIKLLDNKED